MAEKTLARLKIRAARPHEGARLREIAVAANSHWGYEREQVLRWVDNGRIISIMGLDLGD